MNKQEALEVLDNIRNEIGGLRNNHLDEDGLKTILEKAVLKFECKKLQSKLDAATNYRNWCEIIRPDRYNHLLAGYIFLGSGGKVKDFGTLGVDPKIDLTMWKKRLGEFQLKILDELSDGKLVAFDAFSGEYTLLGVDDEVVFFNADGTNQ